MRQGYSVASVRRPGVVDPSNCSILRPSKLGHLSPVARRSLPDDVVGLL